MKTNSGDQQPDIPDRSEQTNLMISQSKLKTSKEIWT